jgi:hypothetical protein
MSIFSKKESKKTEVKKEKVLSSGQKKREEARKRSLSRIVKQNSINKKIEDQKKLKRESIMKHISEVKAKTAIRDEIRKKLGKLHGVRPSRIHLMRRVDEKTTTLNEGFDYIVRKS